MDPNISVIMRFQCTQTSIFHNFQVNNEKISEKQLISESSLGDRLRNLLTQPEFNLVCRQKYNISYHELF